MGAPLITFPRSTKNSIEDTTLKRSLKPPKLGGLTLPKPKLGRIRPKSGKLKGLNLSLFGGKY